MTLNEARDILGKRYPDYTIKVGAECWLWRDKFDIDRRETQFNVRSFTKDATLLASIEWRGDLEGLIRATCCKLDGPADNPAEAVPEEAADAC